MWRGASPSGQEADVRLWRYAALRLCAVHATGLGGWRLRGGNSVEDFTNSSRTKPRSFSRASRNGLNSLRLSTFRRKIIDRGLMRVERIGDCLAPDTMATANYAGHLLARSVGGVDERGTADAFRWTSQEEQPDRYPMLKQSALRAKSGRVGFGPLHPAPLCCT